MQNVICFAIGNKNYVNPMRISIGSFCSYNNSKLIVYLTDNSSDYFNSEFHYNNVEFIDIGETQSKKYFEENSSKFATPFYVFSKEHLFDVFVANELLDRTISKYRKETKAILRLDLDVVFLSSIENSVNKFLESNCKVGSSLENSSMRPAWCNAEIPDSATIFDNYMNMGNFILRMSKDVITNHFQRTLQIFDSYGLNHLYYPDQDAINLIYRNYTKYNMNRDGWLISMADIEDYLEVKQPVFIHYAGLDKPFASKNRDNVSPCFKNTYNWYKQQAIKYKCDDIFIKTIDKRILDTYNKFAFTSNGSVYYCASMYRLLKRWGLT